MRLCMLENPGDMSRYPCCKLSYRTVVGSVDAMYSAGILGVTSLAAHNILFNMIAVAFFLYLGIGVASSTRVGNTLGANLPYEAKRASWLATLFVSVLGLLCGLFLYICRFNIASFYTIDKSVIQQVALTTPLSCIVTLLDGIQTVRFKSR